MDKLTKDILSGSKLELTNPEFNVALMNKIKVESKKRALIHNIKHYSLIFISIDVAIIVLLNLTNINFSDISFKLADFSRVFENIHSYTTGHLIFIYFAVLFIIILMINKISSISLQEG